MCIDGEIFNDGQPTSDHFSEADPLFYCGMKVVEALECLEAFYPQSNHRTILQWFKAYVSAIKCFSRY